MKWVNKHRLRHNFQDCLNPLCSCSLESENRLHYLLHCYHFSQHRIDLMNSVESVSNIFESSCDNNILLYDGSRSDRNKNKVILEATLTYI